MKIRFADTGETYLITGERKQFWLFDKNGVQGKVVKGSLSYTLLEGDTLDIGKDYPGISIREELVPDVVVPPVETDEDVEKDKEVEDEIGEESSFDVDETGEL